MRCCKYIPATVAVEWWWWWRWWLCWWRWWCWWWCWQGSGMIRGVMDDAITGSFIHHKETWASSIDDTSPSTLLWNTAKVQWHVQTLKKIYSKYRYKEFDTKNKTYWNTVVYCTCYFWYIMGSVGEQMNTAAVCSHWYSHQSSKNYFDYYSDSTLDYLWSVHKNCDLKIFFWEIWFELIFT